MSFPTADLYAFISLVGMISICLFLLKYAYKGNYYSYIALFSFRTLRDGVTVTVSYGTPEGASR